MEDQLYDYRQLAIESKKNISLKSMLAVSPNFERLCQVEIERLQKKMEVEQKFLETDMVWKGSEEDLLELVTALYKAEALKQRNNKKISFDEMLRLFEKLFNYQLKGSRVLQETDVGQYKSHTPFLDRLKIAFEAYALERDEDKSKLN